MHLPGQHETLRLWSSVGRCTGTSVRGRFRDSSVALRHTGTAVDAKAMAIVLDGHLVMTGHNARPPRTGREKKPLMPALSTYFLDRFDVERSIRRFSSQLHGSEEFLRQYWRKEAENQKCFCGAVGLDGCCSVQAEQRKKPVAVGPLPGAYLSTETNFVLIRGVTRKENDTGHTYAWWE